MYECARTLAITNRAPTLDRWNRERDDIISYAEPVLFVHETFGFNYRMHIPDMAWAEQTQGRLELRQLSHDLRGSTGMLQARRRYWCRGL
jgi:hypothetical protein